MRKNHIIGGLIVFGSGLFLLYLNSAIVANFMKGLAQPIFLLLGALFLAAALFGKKEFKKIHAAAGAILTVIGLYGLYDEWYSTLDFITGVSPIILIVAGVISLVYGIRKVS